MTILAANDNVQPSKPMMLCEVCGVECERTDVRRKYCEACKKERHRAANKKYAAARPPRKRDPEYLKEKNKRFVERHPGRRAEIAMAYNDRNRDEINRKSRERNQTQARRDYMRVWDAQYRSTPKNRLDQRMKAGISNALKGNKAGRRWESLVGFTLDELTVHLERQFVKGMTWDNIGEWHIDHIVPKSLFSYDNDNSEEFKAAWSLSNLRPLWALENLKKNNKRTLLI